MPAVTSDRPPPVALVATTAATASAAPMPTPPRKRGALRVFQLTSSSSRCVRPPCGGRLPPTVRRAYDLGRVSSRRGPHQLRRPGVVDRSRARRGDGLLAALRHTAARDAVDPLARPRRRESLLARLEQDLPQRDRR